MNQQENTQTATDAIERHRERLKQASLQMIEMATNEPHSALKCIHQLNVMGGATEKAYAAIEQRILTDQDPAGAYHFALMAQNTPDLPIDVRQLVEVVIDKGDNQQRLALLKNLPLPPVEMIEAKIIASNDEQAISQMQAYLKANPEGYGSQHMLSSGQFDQVVPLSAKLPTNDTQ